MPKVTLTRENRISDAFYKDLTWMLKEHGIKQKHLAAALGVSQPAVSKKFQNRALTVEDLIKIVTLTGEELCIRFD